MATRTRTRGLRTLTLQTGRTLPWPAPEPGQILGLPWSSVMAILLAVLTIISSGAQLNRPAFYSKPQVLYEQYYRSVYTGLSEHVLPPDLIPWPDFTHGGLGWYRPGLREVERHANLIRALGDEKVPAILLAAAIANQGSSAQRPFGIDLIERVQYFLGTNFDWPLPSWKWAAQWWQEHLEEPSIGIAQLLPEEARRLRGFGIPDLFDDRTSIRLMYAKLARVSDAAEGLGLNQTQRFILLAIANNDGEGALARLTNYDLELERYIAEHPQTRIQLAKVMSFVDHLSRQGWSLPDGINREYIWWLANQSGGTP